MSEKTKENKIKLSKSEWISVLYIPLTLLYLEIALRIKCGLDIFAFALPSIVLSATAGLIFGGVLLLFKNDKIRKILNLAAIFGLCLYFTVEAFVKGSYQVFMTVDSISKGTGGVLTDFSDAFFKAVTGGFFAIAAMFLPFIIFAVLTYKKFEHGIGAQNRMAVLIFIFGSAFVLNIVGAKIVLSDSTVLNVYRDAYNFDNAVSSFGLMTGTRLDMQYAAFGNPYAESFVIEEPIIPEEPVISAENEDEAPVPDEEKEPEYGYNVLDIDFESIIESTNNSSLKNVHQYVSSLPGTKQNEYTGLFKGKNLILITAESFAKELIDPVLTPTLYRLYTNGFTFTDFYQPTWGGSTSTGEFSILTGIVPTSGVSSILRLVEGNTDFTIGNLLINEGYFSRAYHNGSYDYYSRHLTHEKLGYESFIAFGNGLEEGVNTSAWPSSDLEMMQFTITDYIDKQPFSVYYMTVSGHGFYADFNQAMSTKNKAAVEELPYSTTVKSYIAANLELEYALSYLVEELEKSGIAENTVIALTSDHYPYALEKGEAWGNSEDFLGELYGFTVTNNMERDHNALIIWSGCLENEYKELAVTVDSPCYTLDILPTLCNLFGLPYDSRLLVGRDVFSDAEAIAVWPDYNWKTELGYYDFTRKKFTPADDETVPDEEYINRINNTVKNRIAYSKAVINYDYFNIVFK